MSEHKEEGYFSKKTSDKLKEIIAEYEKSKNEGVAKTDGPLVRGQSPIIKGSKKR